MNTISVYRLSDGLFTGLQLSGDLKFIGANLPEGCGACLGSHDASRMRFDLKTNQAVPYKPPAPPEDALRAWVWNTEANQWRVKPTLKALQLNRLQEVQQAIERQEAAQARPVRELLQALLANKSAAQEGRDRMQAVADEIARLQALRAAVMAAQSEDELNQVKLP